jgi:hypothetical protein
MMNGPAKRMSVFGDLTDDFFGGLILLGGVGALNVPALIISQPAQASRLWWRDWCHLRQHHKR